jgi:hypothetical protein
MLDLIAVGLNEAFIQLIEKMEEPGEESKIIL